jgi:hypothetical protein
MMNVNGQNSTKNGSGRLWVKLGGLFILSFAVFFAIFLGYDLLTTFSERSAARPANEEAPPIVIDPKIESDLAKVLAFDPSPASDTVKDPFSDRGGLTGRLANSAAATTQQVSAVTPGSSRTTSGSSLVLGNTGANGSGGAVFPVIEGTKERYNKWVGQYGITGDVPLDPRVFAIEDLLPVGIVDGGNGQQEVMFFSQAVGKTVSFPLGTLFFDGWLTELRPEGVVFSSTDRRVLRMRSWARSIKNAG